jgi:hypothetical protein
MRAEVSSPCRCTRFCARRYQHSSDVDSRKKDPAYGARCTLAVVHAVRNTAWEVYWLIDEYSNAAAAGEARYGLETSQNWERYAQYAIGKMLFQIITKMERQEEFDPNQDRKLLELAKFVANHSRLLLDWRGLPDLRKILNPRDVSPIRKCQIQESLWEVLVQVVVDEYRSLLLVGEGRWR